MREMVWRHSLARMPSGGCSFGLRGLGAVMTAGETYAWKEASSNSCIQPVGTDRRCVAETDSKLSARRGNIGFFVNVLGISIIFEHQGIVG